MMFVDKIALGLTIAGGLNWGGVGLFGYDTIAALCGGTATLAARVVYSFVALGALWCVSLLFRETD